MNVDEVLDQAALPKAEPDVDKAWATVVQRVERRRGRRRVLVGSCALAFIALAVGAFALQRTSGDVNVAAETEDPRSEPGDAMRELEYLGTRFDVPSSLHVSRPDEYEFLCLTYQADGVFLAPEDAPAVGASCPLTPEYGSTIHVQPLFFDGPADRIVEGEGPDERWVVSTERNRWYEAALPHYGLLFTFYELDEAVREAVLSSVRPANDQERTAGDTPTEASHEDRCAFSVGPDEELVASFEGTGEYEVVCWIDGPIPKSPPVGEDGEPPEPFDRKVVGVRSDGSTTVIKAGYQDSMPPEPP